MVELISVSLFDCDVLLGCEEGNPGFQVGRTPDKVELVEMLGFKLTQLLFLLLILGQGLVEVCLILSFLGDVIVSISCKYAMNLPFAVLLVGSGLCFKHLLFKLLDVVA